MKRYTEQFEVSYQQTCFSLNPNHWICSLFIGAVKKNPSTAAATRCEVERVVKNWLRYAKDRTGIKRPRIQVEERSVEEETQDEENQLTAAKRSNVTFE